MLDFSFTEEPDQTHKQPNTDASVIIVKPFDLAVAQRLLTVYSAEISRMKQEAAALKVDSDDSNKTAVEMTAQAKRLARALKGETERLIEEPDRFVKAVKGTSAPFIKDLQGIEADLKGKIGNYSFQLELKRREEERKAQAERDRLQRELNAQAKAAQVAPVELPKMVLPAKATAPVRTAEGTSGTRMKWTHEITGPLDLIPRVYLMPDPKAIQAAVDAGIREIAGVRIYEKPIVSVRGY